MTRNYRVSLPPYILNIFFIRMDGISTFFSAWVIHLQSCSAARNIGLFLVIDTVNLANKKKLSDSTRKKIKVVAYFHDFCNSNFTNSSANTNSSKSRSFTSWHIEQKLLSPTTKPVATGAYIGCSSYLHKGNDVTGRITYVWYEQAETISNIKRMRAPLITNNMTRADYDSDGQGVGLFNSACLVLQLATIQSKLKADIN